MMLMFKRGLVAKRANELKWLAAALAILAVLLVSGLHVSAQSNGLGITPKLSYTVAPGSQRSDTLYVNNLSTSEPLNIKLTVVDFKPQDESGTPQLLQAADAPQTPWSLKPYITLPDSVTIAPGKSKLIPFTIKFPAGVGAGSYYSAVEYIAQNGASNPERVNVAASSATLVFATVPGKAKEQLSLLDFGATETQKSGKSDFKSIFTSKPPSSFAYRVKNEGNISESPNGSIVIKNIFGHIVASINNANPRSELVLLGQTRRFEVCYPKSTSQEKIGKQDNCQPLKLKPGMYTAEIQLLYGLNGQATRQIGYKSTFWYLPVWFIVLVAIILAAIAYGVYRVYRKVTAPRHRHKRKS
jgi:hypothetical protein